MDGEKSPGVPRLGLPACDWWNGGLRGVARAVFGETRTLAAAN